MNDSVVLDTLHIALYDLSYLETLENQSRRIL